VIGASFVQEGCRVCLIDLITIGTSMGLVGDVVFVHIY
jgi:hypothetical protein